MKTMTTKVFNNGNSQAVRIPAEFRLEGERVNITLTDTGDLIIQPLAVKRGAALLSVARAVCDADQELFDTLETEEQDQLAAQDREDL